MAFNSSRSPDSWCWFPFSLNASKSNSVYYQVLLTFSVVISLLAPMAVVANAFILAAIWKNPSLRTPSGLCSSCWFGLHRLLHWVTKSTILCGVPTDGISWEQKDVLHCWCYHRKCCILPFHPNRSGHDNNSCRKMAAYEPKNSSYGASSRCYLYHVCSFANCVLRMSHV